MSYSLAEGLSRKVGFPFPSLASVTKVQSSTPCHMGWCRPSQDGTLRCRPAVVLPMKHHCATELFEVTEGSQSILIGQEKDISYQSWGFFIGDYLQ